MAVYYCFPGGKTKALTMSYDDGVQQDERLVGIFNKYGIKGTFNLNYGLMDRPERIGRDKVQAIYQGHEISTHTLTHPSIARCPLPMAAQEILQDRMGLESLAGYAVRGHAYPNGSYSKEIEALFSQLGIAYGRVVEAVADYELPDNPMEWHPTCHHNDKELMEKAGWFAGLTRRQHLRLLYVWGHSYEFDDHDNWDVIETFCEYMGGRDDIWYASNIEIIDYMQVMKNLIFTADGQRVYNPSVQSAFLLVDDARIIEASGGVYTTL